MACVRAQVIYIEACESGSMGVNIPSDIGVLMTTAAQAWQSSYAWYMDVKRQTYLADGPGPPGAVQRP
jgi:hypothetical protein